MSAEAEIFKRLRRLWQSADPDRRGHPDLIDRHAIILARAAGVLEVQNDEWHVGVNQSQDEAKPPKAGAELRRMLAATIEFRDAALGMSRTAMRTIDESRVPGRDRLASRLWQTVHQSYPDLISRLTVAAERFPVEKPRRTGRPTKQAAAAITAAAVAAYSEIVGEKASTRAERRVPLVGSNVPERREPTGPFFSFLQGIYEIAGIDASVGSQAKAAGASKKSPKQPT